MCFALRLHMSATPSQGGLTQALGGRKAFCSFALQHGDFTGFGSYCSSDKFSARCHFVQVCRARSNVACVAFAGFGCNELHRLGSPRRTRCFGIIRLKVHEARSGIPASAFGKSATASPSPGSSAPNNSFKPTPCRGVGHVLYATLAHVRRPATGRLNSGVRRQKSA